MPSKWMKPASRVFCVALLILALGASTARGESSALVEAVRSQDMTAAMRLLKQGTDVNQGLPDGATALHWAAHLDNLEATDALLAAGARPNLTNDYGVTPLMLAAENGSPVMVARLLAAGADPSAALPSGETVLMTASRTGRVGAVSALLAGGAAVDAQETIKGQTALMWALSEAHVDVAKALIEGGATVDLPSKEGFTALMFATRAGSVDAVRLLLAHGAAIDKTAGDGTAALHIATVRGHVDLAEFLLEQGADPNADGPGYTPLHYVVGKWDGVDAFHYQDAPGEWANLLGLPREKRLQFIPVLFAHGADPNARMTKEPPRYGFSLVNGVARMTNGSTPFFLAAMAADTELMRMLVANGADPMLTSKNGTTPLMMAAGMGWMENEVLTTEDEYLEALALCVELGLDPDAQNSSGETALHATVQMGPQPDGFNKIVSLLAEAGANLSIKNKRGQTPLKITRGYGAAGGNHVRLSTDALLVSLGATE